MSLLSLVLHANSTMRTIIDSLGHKKIEWAWPLGALLHRLENSNSALLAAEGKRIAQCAELIDVVSIDSRKIVVRQACGSAFCPVCGLRPTTDKLRHLISGMETYRASGVPLLFVTIALPDSASPTPAKAIQKAKKVFAKFVRKLRLAFAIDWWRCVELRINASRCGSHVHCVLAVPSDVPDDRRRVDKRRLRSSRRILDVGLSDSLLQQELFEIVRLVGLEVLAGEFPEHAQLYYSDLHRSDFVHVVPVDDEPQSPACLAAYCTKALRCGLTILGLLDVPIDLLEFLLLAVKAPNSSRSCRLSQSAANSLFSKPQTQQRRDAPPRRRAQRPDTATRKAKTRRELDDFLHDRMEPAVATAWIRARGWAMHVALLNDNDFRAYALLGRILSASTARSVPPDHGSLPVPSVPFANSGGPPGCDSSGAVRSSAEACGVANSPTDGGTSTSATFSVSAPPVAPPEGSLPLR